jgi:hypothetical protein
LLETTSDEAELAKLASALDEIEIEYKARHLDRARAAYRSLAGHDIHSPGDLIRGRYRVIKKLPSPEPDAIPESLSRGSIWEIDPETDRIVSSYLGARYEIHYAGFDREHFEKRGEKIEEDSGHTNQEVDRHDG